MPPMSPRHIPARRSRPVRTGAGPSTGTRNGGPPAPTPYRPRHKRVRAGSVSAKLKRQRKASAAGTAPEPKPAPAPQLSEKQRRHLRGLAHELKPIIRLGNAGLTEAVTQETARALHDHELVKVKAAGGGEREVRDALFAELAQRTASALIHRIGNVAVLYRPNPKLSRIMIPDAG